MGDSATILDFVYLSRSRSPILRRRRSEHDRGGGGRGRGRGRGRERENVRERTTGSQDPPMRRNSDRPVDRHTHNERYYIYCFSMLPFIYNPFRLHSVLVSAKSIEKYV